MILKISLKGIGMAKLYECTTCGGKVSGNAKTCPHCGEDGGASEIKERESIKESKKVAKRYIKLKRKSYIVVLLLTGFLGGFGLFYVGVWSALLIAGLQVVTIALIPDPAPAMLLSLIAVIFGVLFVRSHNKNVEAESLI